MYCFNRFLPQIAPARFPDVDFYRGLERIGCREVLLDGEEPAQLVAMAARLKRDTRLVVVLWPAVREGACADILVARALGELGVGMPRRFGATVTANATVIGGGRILHEPVARVVVADGPRRCHAAFSMDEPEVLSAYAQHARLHGYRWLAVDLSDSARLDGGVVGLVRGAGMRLAVEHAFSPEAAAAALAMGVDTVVVRSDVFAAARDPLALAAEYHARIARPAKSLDEAARPRRTHRNRILTETPSDSGF